MSDDAKRFAIAREVERAKANYYFTNGIIMPSMILIGYLFSRFANKKAMLFKRPPIVRFVMYGIVASVVTFLAVVIEDMNTYYIEGNLDHRTCRLGINYAKGGVEYYENQLKRHITLRSLLPDNGGKNVYNLHGDQWPPLIRGYKYRPITQRKQECMKIFDYLQTNIER